MIPRARVAPALALAASALLAGCAGDFAAMPSAPPMARPDFDEIAAPDSGASAELADYYRRVQNGLLSQGLLRTDGGGPDAPYSERDLVRNFLKIAFYEEYADAGGRLVARESASRMHRWAKPVTLSVEFGASVDPASRSRDTNELRSFVNRLARVTGHPVQNVAAGSGNFRVFIVNEDERRALGPVLKRIMPNISATALNTVINLPRSTYCLAFATDPEQDGTYDQAVAVIRAEHPDLLRASCIQEEVAQGLGLSNDYALARPSIFNDDEEFGFLTTHDELLLKMLYDKRLTPGMSETEARPIVEQIAAELLGGEV
ncbi:DUF2927 domain-containing protein [Sinisalibacter aestuarii]|uniref:DUF2927 domain-containing protein n=1 Tax=Sinisalibacter aestuarii TaxID=2949426 RepID=A0ABQ5LWC0_9RHOB|nr:DUF2927 domain-containing protein [Sinisalibacter aestuarii]GKY89282.1 hypothetical protein STA1M1_31510 [Sinisalibacter aestuarii]